MSVIKNFRLKKINFQLISQEKAKLDFQHKLKEG